MKKIIYIIFLLFVGGNLFSQYRALNRGGTIVRFQGGFSDPLSEGLVAYYPFNGNADDESGNENDGTVNGATLTTDRYGNPNSAYSFDGVGNRVQLPSIALGDRKATLSAWVSTSISTTALQSIIGRYYGTDLLTIQNTHIGTNYQVNILQTTEIYDIKKFYFITSTYDGTLSSDNIKLYVNGILVTTKDATDEFLRDANSWQIGADGNSSNYFQGDLDDVRIYNRALSEDEVSQLFVPLTKAELDNYLSSLVDYYTDNPPTENYTLDLTGDLYPVPNDGASNTYLLQLDSIFTTEGYTLTVLVNE